MDAVAQLEAFFLPLLQEEEKRLSAEYPTFKFNVWSLSVGGHTDYQGHDVGIECTFPDAIDDEADSVALIVGVKHLTTAPVICEASVGWGSGEHPQVASDLLETPIPLSQEALQALATQLPALLQTFWEALQAWGSRRIHS